MTHRSCLPNVAAFPRPLLALVPWIFAIETGGSEASAQQLHYLYVTDVANTTGWIRETEVIGEPLDIRCEGQPNDWAANDTTTPYELFAYLFTPWNVPPGTIVTGVWVDTLARYTDNAQGGLRLRVRTDQGTTVRLDTVCFDSGSQGQCRWRFEAAHGAYGLDIWPQLQATGVHPNQISILDVLINRTTSSCTNSTNLKVKAIRFVVRTEADCNGNGVPDAQELIDCNANGILDVCDIASGYSADCDGNGRPDECSGDCDGDGVPNAVEICQGAPDCDDNGMPDSCQLFGNDCNGNGVPDHCEFEQMAVNGDFYDVSFGTTTRLLVTQNDPGWNSNSMRPVVVDQPQYGTAIEGQNPGEIEFVSSNFDNDCGDDEFRYVLEGLGACSNQRSQEVLVRLRVQPSPNDCNHNCREDAVDIATGVSRDCDGDGVPTECETTMEDCNGNGLPDCFELDQQLVLDLDQNGVPDNCQSFSWYYCQSQVNSAGCAARISYSGLARLSASTLQVMTDNLLHPTFGLMLWSRQPASIPLGAGTLCVGGSIQRTRVQASVASSNTPPCRGWLGYEWTSAELQLAGLAVGDRAYCQYWSRDAAAPGGSNLTNAVEFQVLP